MFMNSPTGEIHFAIISVITLQGCVDLDFLVIYTAPRSEMINMFCGKKNFYYLYFKSTIAVVFLLACYLFYCILESGGIIQVLFTIFIYKIVTDTETLTKCYLNKDWKKICTIIFPLTLIYILMYICMYIYYQN